MHLSRVLQFGHDEFVVESTTLPRWGLPGCCCVNSATTNSSWRALDAEAELAIIKDASIRPRRIRRGERAEVYRRETGLYSFNSATTNSSWRAPVPRRARGTLDAASIRPRRIRRGEHLRQF